MSLSRLWIIIDISDFRDRLRLLIEWNKVIFSTLLPAVWAAVLESMAIQSDHLHLQDFLALWPSTYAHTTSDDSVYLKAVPKAVLHRIVTTDATVWPLFSNSPDAPLMFVALDENILVAPTDEDGHVLTVLTRCGVQIVLATSDVVDLVRTTRFCHLLSPTTAHDALLVGRHLPQMSLHLLR